MGIPGSASPCVRAADRADSHVSPPCLSVASCSLSVFPSEGCGVMSPGMSGL